MRVAHPRDITPQYLWTEGGRIKSELDRLRQPRNLGRCLRDFEAMRADAREFGEPSPRVRFNLVTPFRTRRGHKDNSSITVNEHRQRRRNRLRRAREENRGCPFTKCLSKELWKMSGEPEKEQERQQQIDAVAEEYLYFEFFNFGEHEFD